MKQQVPLSTLLPPDQQLSANQIREFLHESRQTTVNNSRQSCDFEETILNQAKLEKIMMKQTFLESNNLFDPAAYFGGLHVEDLSAKINDNRLEEMFKTQPLPSQQQSQQVLHNAPPSQTFQKLSTPLLCKSPSTTLCDITNIKKSTPLTKKQQQNNQHPSPIPSKRKPAVTTANPIGTPNSEQHNSNTTHHQSYYMNSNTIAITNPHSRSNQQNHNSSTSISTNSKTPLKQRPTNQQTLTQSNSTLALVNPQTRKTPKQNEPQQQYNTNKENTNNSCFSLSSVQNAKITYESLQPQQQKQSSDKCENDQILFVNQNQQSEEQSQQTTGTIRLPPHHQVQFSFQATNSNQPPMEEKTNQALITQSQSGDSSMTSFHSNSVYNQIQLLQAVQQIESQSKNQNKSYMNNNNQKTKITNPFTNKEYSSISSPIPPQLPHFPNNTDNTNTVPQSIPSNQKWYTTTKASNAQQSSNSGVIAAPPATFGLHGSTHSISSNMLPLHSSSLLHSETTFDNQSNTFQQAMQSQSNELSNNNLFESTSHLSQSQSTSRLPSSRVLLKQSSMSRMFEQKLASELFFKDKENLELTFQDDDDDDEEVEQHEINPNNHQLLLNLDTHNNQQQQPIPKNQREESIISFSKMMPTFQNDSMNELLSPLPQQPSQISDKTLNKSIISKFSSKEKQVENGIHSQQTAAYFVTSNSSKNHNHRLNLQALPSSASQPTSSTTRLRKSNSSKNTLLVNNDLSSDRIGAMTSRSNNNNNNNNNPKSSFHISKAAMSNASATNNHNSSSTSNLFSVDQTSSKLSQPFFNPTPSSILSPKQSTNSKNSTSSSTILNHTAINNSIPNESSKASVSNQTYLQSTQDPISHHYSSQHNFSKFANSSINSHYNSSQNLSHFNSCSQQQQQYPQNISVQNKSSNKISNGTTIALVAASNNMNASTSTYLRRPEGKGSFDFRSICPLERNSNSNNQSTLNNPANLSKSQRRCGSPDVSPANHKPKLQANTSIQQIQPGQSTLRQKKMQHRIASGSINLRQNESSLSSQSSVINHTAQQFPLNNASIPQTTSGYTSLASGTTLSGTTTSSKLSTSSVQSSQFSSIQNQIQAQSQQKQQQQPYQLSSIYQQSQVEQQNSYIATTSSIATLNSPVGMAYESKRSPSTMFAVDQKFDPILNHFIKMNGSIIAPNRSLLAQAHTSGSSIQEN